MRLVRGYFIVAFGFLVGAAGCASLIGLDSATTLPPTEAGTDPSPVDGPSDDAGDLLDGEVTQVNVEACAPASRVSPTTTEVGQTTSGTTCGRPDSVLSADGVVIGLDYKEGPDEKWGIRYVTGCVGVGFVGGPFSALTVRARAVRKACGNDCTDTPEASTGCGTGHFFGVFVRGTDGGDPEWLTTKEISTSFEDHTVGLPPSVGTNPYLYVCRSSSNRLRDDVEVDYVAACR